MNMNRRVSRTVLIVATALLASTAGAFAGDGDDANDRVRNVARLCAENLKQVQQAVALYDKEHTAPKLVERPFAGEYVGTFTSADGNSLPAVAKVNYFLKPRPGYVAALYAVKSGLVGKAIIGKDTQCAVTVDMRGTVDGDKLKLAGGKFTGVISGDKCSAKSPAGTFDLKRFDRKSPTLGEKPPAGAIVLLPFEPNKTPDMSEWTNKTWKAFLDGSMQVGSDNNRTVRKFRNFRLHAEFMTVSGKGGGNSGFYLLDRYEVQVFDSFGLMPQYKGGCGAIYQTFAPSANACLPPGEWQTYDITFHGPVMDGKKVVRHPRITVVHNGVVVHDDVEIPHATGHAQPKGDAAEGPIVLQDHGCPDRFRNIWVVELDDK